MGISPSKKKLLCEFQDMVCESCHKIFKLSELDIHRIRQGCDYSQHRSLMVVCHKCHEIFSSAQRIANGTQT